MGASLVNPCRSTEDDKLEAPGVETYPVTSEDKTFANGHMPSLFASPAEQSQAAPLLQSSQTLPEGFVPTNEASTNDEDCAIVAAHNDQSMVQQGSKAVDAPAALEEHEENDASINHVPDHTSENGSMNENVKTQESVLEKPADDAVGVQSEPSTPMVRPKRVARGKTRTQRWVGNSEAKAKIQAQAAEAQAAAAEMETSGDQMVKEKEHNGEEKELHGEEKEHDELSEEQKQKQHAKQLLEVIKQRKDDGERRFSHILGQLVTFKEMCEALLLSEDDEIARQWAFTDEERLEEHWEGLKKEGEDKMTKAQLKMICAWETPKCSQGHFMMERNGIDRMCDICDKIGTSHHCSDKCNFDLCQKCYGDLKQIAKQASAEVPTCVMGHPLMSTSRMEANVCDMCETKGSCAYRCSKTCNYDLCLPCFQGLHDLGDKVAEIKREEDAKKEAEAAEEREKERQLAVSKSFRGRILRVMRTNNFWKLLRLMLRFRPWKALVRRRRPGRT